MTDKFSLSLSNHIVELILFVLVGILAQTVLFVWVGSRWVTTVELNQQQMSNQMTAVLQETSDNRDHLHAINQRLTVQGTNATHIQDQINRIHQFLLRKNETLYVPGYFDD